MKWFHAIGICGKITSKVANLYKQEGYFVTGSDLQILPPVSDFLKEKNLHYADSYSFKHLTKNFWQEKLKIKLDIPEIPDECLIVETITNKNPEYLFAKKNNIPIRPYSLILKEKLIKEESIVIAGTAGKTSTSSFITYTLKNLGLNPSFMSAGDSLNLESMLENTSSKFSVVEGDEFYSLIFSSGAKFLNYKPKYVILTNVGWEHQDVYPTEKRYIEEFQKLIDLIPSDGFIIANFNSKNIKEKLNFKFSKIYFYGFSEKPKKNFYTINSNGQVFFGKNYFFTLKTDLIGKHNLENFLACFVLLKNIGLESSQLPEIVRNYRGIKKRLEIIYKGKNNLIFDDFAPTPNRVEVSLKTLKEYFPDYKITCIYEPNSASRINNPEILNKIYKGSFTLAENIIIPELSSMNPDSQLNSVELSNYLTKLGFNSMTLNNSDLMNFLIKKLEKKSKNLFVFYSTYRFETFQKEFKLYTEKWENFNP